MTTQHATWIDADMINLNGGLFAEMPPVRSALCAAQPSSEPSTMSRKVAPRTAQAAVRRRFLNLAMSVAAVAYSVSYLGTLAFLKHARAAAPAVKAEVAIVAEVPSSTSTSERQGTSPAISQEVPEQAASAKPMISVGVKPAFKAATKWDKASSKATITAASVETRSPGLNAAAAGTAIAMAAGRAGSCLKAGDARTTMSVKVTFAPSGRVTTALLNGGPFMATEEGSCIARAMRTARVGAFEGGPVTVTRTVRVR
jgi:hypothetical protein